MSAKPRYSDNIRRVSVHSSYRDGGKRSQPSSADQHHEAALPTNAFENNGAREEDDGHVKVAVRCRPMSDKELAAGFESIVEFEDEHKIVVHDVSETPSDQLGTKSGERRNVSHVYEFDCVFDCQSSQEEIYNRACRPIVQGALEGYNGTIFAYGQTGTGKTYTMEGLGQSYRRRSSLKRADGGQLSGNEGADVTQAGRRRRSSANKLATAEQGPCQADQQVVGGGGGGGGQAPATKQQAGIIPRTFEQIFDHVTRHPEIKFLIRASYLEIYQEEIRDLLKKDKTIKLELHERPDIGVYVKELTSFVCKSISEIERVMRVGNQNRIVGATDMNEHSSRSHAIFMITIEQQSSISFGVARGEQEGGEGNNVASSASNNLVTTGEAVETNKKSVIRVGKLNLVDLAGSERQRKTNSSGQRQRESIKINLSLSALGNVINSLMKIQQQRQQQQQQQQLNDLKTGGGAPLAPIHTPYRDSKLTRLLQDSLGGNAKTLMIANIGPASYNYDETINTLNYASRARCIKNRPKLNEDPKDALLRRLQLEIDLLRSKLATIDQQQQQQPRPGIATISSKLTGGSEQSSGVSSAKSSRGSAGSLSPGRPGGGNGGERLVERELFELRQKLSSLESKLLNGDRSSSMVAIEQTGATNRADGGVSGRLSTSVLKGFTREQELELERRQDELANQVGRERAIRDELERREEAEMLAKQSFSSIQQEVDSKRRLIRQVLLKVKSLRDEIETTQAAYRTELDELDQLQYVLQRELKLKCLIMDNFVPNIHVDQLLSRINFDDKRNMCYIQPLELPTSERCQLTLGGEQAANRLKFEDFWRPTYDSIRPRSEFERISEAIYPNNIRHKYEELIEPRLEIDLKPMGARRLSDQLRAAGHLELSGGQPGAAGSGVPGLQDLLDRALNQRETDIVI